MTDKKDLGLKVATKKEALWMKVRDETEMLIQQHTDALTIQKEVLELAKNKIKIEQYKK